jgi:hypothetical protein
MANVEFYGDLLAAYGNAKHRFATRDERCHTVALARAGEVDKLMPGLFPKRFPKQIVANVVDLAARDLGELLGQLPEVHARAGKPGIAGSREQAAKRTRILIDMMDRSRLQKGMYTACDRFVSFGALAIVVTADFNEQRIKFRPASPKGAYWTTDAFGRVVTFFESWYESVADLVAKFPELKYRIKYGKSLDHMGIYDLAWDPNTDNEMVEVVRYYDEHKMCMFLPGKDGLATVSAPNPTPGVVPVFLAELPWWGEGPAAGNYDQALWVQVARARMATFTIEAAHKSINAPIRMPKDVTEFRYGPNAKIQTDSTAANAVERVRLDMPPGVFAENEALAQEARTAARFPEGRSGNIDASVITGQGVKELLGTIDSQVQTYQDLIAIVLKDASSYALRLDEALWPEKDQDIEGDADGAPFVESYVPTKDIAGNYSVKVSYGLAYGMDAQRGLIFALQLRGDKEIPRRVVREQYAKAFNASADDLAKAVDDEDADDALKAGIQQWAASFPAMAQMGQDPTQMLRQLARWHKNRARGLSNVEALIKALEPTKEELEAQKAQQQQVAANNPIEAAMQELGATPQGAAPGGAPGGGAAPPGGLQMLMSSLNQAGDANASVQTRRMNEL